MTPSVDGALWALAAFGLHTDTALPREGWDVRLDEVFDNGLTGFLAEAWQSDAISLTDESLTRLQARLEAEAMTAVRLEAELLRLEPVLSRFGGVVLKGPVLAHGAYTHPALRPFTDLDLLVPGRVIQQALGHLVRMGYVRPRPDPTRSFASRVGKATVLVHPHALSVDLHRTLVAGVAGDLIDVDDVCAGRWILRAGDVAVPAPRWPAHLIEVALHAVIGDRLGRALSIRDVVEVARHPALDVDAAIETAVRWQTAEALRVGLRAARELLRVDLPSSLESWLRTPRVPSRPWVLKGGKMNDLVHGSLRRRVGTLRALTLPSAQFVRWRYRDMPTAGRSEQSTPRDSSKRRIPQLRG